MYDLQIGAIFYSRLVKKNFAVKLSLKKNKVEKISGSGLTFEDLQTVYSRLGNEGLIVILAQPLSSSPTIITSRVNNGSNLSYNSQVLRRKHPGLGIKWNLLSLLFQLVRHHHNNTNRRLQNNGFRTFHRNHMFSVALYIMCMRA